MSSGKQARAPKPQSQDFFPKKLVEKTKGFIFNQAPLNKNKAFQETKDNREGFNKKRSAFVAKLYQDEDDIENEMKVFNMGKDSDDEKVKDGKKEVKKQQKVEKIKIGKLRFSKGSLGMFCINEVHDKYLIVNYTRNVKGYIPVEGVDDLKSKFEIGQFIVASILQEGTYNYNTTTSGNQNKKLQLTIDLSIVNKSLTTSTILNNMVIQGTVESKEAKGHLLNFGMKDKTKGFLTFSQESAHLQIGQYVLVTLKTVSDNSKIVKCDIINKMAGVTSLPQNGEYTLHNIKPGFLVQAKVTQIFDNGIEIGFLGGFSGNIFSDHLEKEASKYKVGEKLVSRLIAIDPLTKNLSLTLLPHLVRLQSKFYEIQTSGISVGKIYKDVKITRQIYGGSYQIALSSTQSGFLHKSHLQESGEDKKEVEIGQILPQVIVKEINYFDNLPILSARESYIKNPTLDYVSLKVGQFTTGKIEEVHEKEKFITIRVNDFVKGSLHLEHMGEQGSKIIPPKFKEIGKEIKVRVFNIDAEKRIIEFTKKDALMKDTNKVPVYQSHTEVNKGDKLIGIVVGENEYGYIIKSFGGIKGLLTFKEIKENGKKVKQEYKFGNVIKAFVLFKKKEQGMALTLSKKLAKSLKEESEGKKQKVEITSFEEKYLPSQEEAEIIKSKFKSLQKQSKNKENVGKVFQYRLVDEKDFYYIIKSLDSAKNIFGLLPKCLLNTTDSLEISKDTSYTGLVLDIVHEIPILSSQQDLIDRQLSIPVSQEFIENGGGQLLVGIVNDISAKGVNIRFFKGLKKMVLIKDLDDYSNVNSQYKIGQVVQVGNNKLGRLSLKQKVISYLSHPGETATSIQKGFVDMSTGSAISGIIKSKKEQCLFVLLPHVEGQTTIGRLHIMECDSKKEFNDMKIGDRITAKILQVFQSKKKTWIELTKLKDHMKNPIGLNKSLLSQMLHSYEDLKSNQSYKACISSVNKLNSSPISISLSPFVKGSIHFSQISSVDDFLDKGIDQVLNRFKQGEIVNVFFSSGKFSIINKEIKEKQKYTKGELVVVRAIKVVNGKGLSVQVDESTFGFIEICEITDEIRGQVMQIAKQILFVARVIGFDQKAKPILSIRESIVDKEQWKIISPEGKSINFQKTDEKMQKIGNQRNKIIKFGANVAIQEGDLCLGYVTNIGKNGCFIQIGHQTSVRAALNELSDSQEFNYQKELPLDRLVFGRIIKVESKGETKRFHFSLRKSIVIYGTTTSERSDLTSGKLVEAIVLKVLEGKAFAQIKGSYNKIKVKKFKQSQLREGDWIQVMITKSTKIKISGEYQGQISVQSQITQSEQQIEHVYNSVQEEAQKDISNAEQNIQEIEIDDKLFVQKDEIDMQIDDLQELQNEDQEMEDEEDSDKEEIQRIIKKYQYESESDQEEEAATESEADDESEQKNQSSSESESDKEEEKFDKKKSGKKALKDRINKEKQIRLKEQSIRENKDQPKSVDDFERLLFANQDQSYVWIQYLAFMLDKLGIESARRIAERAVSAVSISNEEDKLNIWIAYMNLENNFGNQDSLQKVIKRALEINDRKKIYLQLVNIYQASKKYQYIEDIFKLLIKKYSTSLKILSSYLDFLFQIRNLKLKKESPDYQLVADLEVTEPKQVLQKALQSLPSEDHVNLISKFGILEFKYGTPENGRTMLEGIVNNYPKRMDIWSVYMDMEVKYGGKNNQQARHLFERCLTNEGIKKNPKKIKLVFQKYMDFEVQNGNKKNVEKLKERVEEYLEKFYGKKEENTNMD